MSKTFRPGYLVLTALLLAAASGCTSASATRVTGESTGATSSPPPAESAPTTLPTAVAPAAPTATTPTTVAPSTPSAPMTNPAPQAAPAAFDPGRALKHVKALSHTIGVRRSGTAGERRGARYVADQLRKLGLKPHIDRFPLPRGRRSLNVSVTLPARPASGGAPAYNGKYLVFGAHMDSKAPSPGANDNASGCAVLLEFARMFKQSPPPITVKLVFFGAEEIVDSNPDHHHYGSRYLAKTTRKGSGLIGVVSVDDVGVGPDLRVRAMRRGPSILWRQLLRDRSAAGVRAGFLKDKGWSDHEPFEVRGYPVAWIEWRPDPAGHTRRDGYQRVRKGHMKAVAKWLTTYLDTLGPGDVAALTKAAPK